MNYYREIKEELINNEITKKVKDYSKNRSDLNTYYNVGKLLSDAGKHYGEGIIKEYSNKLIVEVNKKYSTRLLFRMRRLYMFFKEIKMPTLSAKLTISHYDELFKLNSNNKINYYIKITEQQNLSVRQLREKIKNKEYERLDEKTKEKLMSNEEPKVNDLIKNPILIKNSYDYKEISEKILQKLILEDLPNFMKELGEGFSFIDSEYKIKMGDKYNYIDLLLYNVKYKCYVEVELKVAELSYKHTGQIQNYMNYINHNVKNIDDNETVGIIICKKENKYVIEYCSDSRIISRRYELV